MGSRRVRFVSAFATVLWGGCSGFLMFLLNAATFFALCMAVIAQDAGVWTFLAYCAVAAGTHDVLFLLALLEVEYPVVVGVVTDPKNDAKGLIRVRRRLSGDVVDYVMEDGASWARLDAAEMDLFDGWLRAEWEERVRRPRRRQAREDHFRALVDRADAPRGSLSLVERDEVSDVR